jgi:hypothetical protein
LLAYFFTFSDAEKQRASPMLCTVGTQLLGLLPEVPSSLKTLYKNKVGGNPTSKVLLEVLQILAQSSNRAFLEIAESDRSSLLATIQTLMGPKYPHLSFLVTSRKERYILEVLDHLNITQIGLQTAIVDDGIAKYVGSQLTENPKLKKWAISVRKDIEIALTEGAHGMYRTCPYAR